MRSQNSVMSVGVLPPAWTQLLPTLCVPWEEMTRSQLRTVLFDYIEAFYNRQRHQAGLGHRTPLEVYHQSRLAA